MKTTKPSPGCKTRKSWEESKTAGQGWAGGIQFSSGLKPPLPRQGRFPGKTESMDSLGGNHQQSHNLGRHQANSAVTSQLPHTGSV